MNSLKVTSKHLRLPTRVVEILEKEANAYGYKFNDWVKFLLTKQAFELKNINKLVEDSLKESNNSQLSQLKTPEEIRAYIDSI